MGSPFIFEEWKDLTTEHIPELYSDYLYKISNIGNIFNKKADRYVRMSKSGNGYMTVALLTKNGYKTFLVHRLVGLVFLGSPPSKNLVINHKNGIKDWNTINNLEWTSYSGNNKHAYDNNLKLKGEQCSMSKLTEEQVKEICSLLETNMNIGDIAKKVGNGVTETNIYDIIYNRCWTDISCNYNFYTGPRVDNMRSFSEEKVRNLCSYFQSNPIPFGMKVDQYCAIALNNFGYEVNGNDIRTLSRIYRRLTYKKISKDYIF